MQAEIPLSIPYSTQHLPLKRSCDILISLALLIILAPVFLLLALIVKFSSTGSVIFADQRVGRAGSLFRCYKFRTMHSDAQERLQQLLVTDPTAKQDWATHRKLQRDPRVTSAGYWLRRTSLDELPQLWNVIVGDMSLVGPRPVSVDELDTHFGFKAAKIVQMRPGITGLWQTSGRSNMPYHERILLDEQYIDQHSLLLDFQLLLKTIPVVLSSRGAY